MLLCYRNDWREKGGEMRETKTQLAVVLELGGDLEMLHRAITRHRSGLHTFLYGFKLCVNHCRHNLGAGFI